MSTNGQSKWLTIYNHINITSMKLFSPSNAIADDVFRYRFLFANTNFRYINCIASFVVLLNVCMNFYPTHIKKYVNRYLESFRHLRELQINQFQYVYKLYDNKRILFYA